MRSIKDVQSAIVLQKEIAAHLAGNSITEDESRTLNDVLEASVNNLD